MNVVVLKSNPHLSLVREIFLNTLKRDFDVVMNEDKKDIYIGDIDILFLTEGKFSRKVRKIIKVLIKQNKDVYYVGSDLKIQEVYLTKWLCFTKIRLSKYYNILASILPVKKEVEDLEL